MICDPCERRLTPKRFPQQLAAPQETASFSCYHPLCTFWVLATMPKLVFLHTQCIHPSSGFLISCVQAKALGDNCKVLTSKVLLTSEDILLECSGVFSTLLPHGLPQSQQQLPFGSLYSVLPLPSCCASSRQINNKHRLKCNFEVKVTAQ